MIASHIILIIYLLKPPLQLLINRDTINLILLFLKTIVL